MKHIKILTLAAGLFALAACQQEKIYEVPDGFDASKPAVASFEYNEATSSSTAAGFTWSADQAVSAGATSYTIELTDDVSQPNPVNASKISVINVPATDGVIKSLKKGSFYYARIRANYPEYKFSKWTYLGSETNPSVVCVGSGIVNAAFGAPANLAATVTETSFKATWDAVPFAENYTFEYKPASSGDWTTVSELTATTYEVENLVAKTAYDVRVKAIKGETASDYATISVTTLEPSKFNPAMSTAAAFLEFIKNEAATASTSSEFSLEADIDLAGQNVPDVESFKGVLDGKGHAIKGLEKGTPLFNTLSGTVKNVVIDAGCKFTPTVAFFGIIAGDNQGTISGVTNKAAINYTADDIVEPMLVAAIAGQSSGEISGCTNEGNITVTSAGVLTGVGVAGIAGYQAAAVKNCVNKGNITVNGKYVASKVTVVAAEGALPSTGGLVAYGAPGFSMENCDNHGTVSYKLSAIDTYLQESTANLNRNQHGGVVGSPCGIITNCHNYGKVDIAAKHSTPGTSIVNEGSFKREFILCVGGIGGGDYHFTNTGDGPYSNTSYINCTNEGAIIVDSDAAQSNSAVGGIVGWPGQEKPTTGTSVSGCVNKGSVTGKGAMKCRLGGIEGGTGVMENCTNEGVITLESGAAASVIGSLCGFHSQGHAITGCTAKGEVVAKVKVTGGVGGLIGNIGNVDHDTATGCVVNCKITMAEAAPETTGFVVGYFNGTSKVITLGSTSDPIQVSGTLNGAAPTADTIRGTKNTNANHTINYVIK